MSVAVLESPVEAPAFVSRLVDLVLATGVLVTLALEIPRGESARTARFLASSGAQADRTALLAGPFWQSTYQDGRRSLAMADLLEEVRALATAGKAVRVVFIDGAGAGGVGREESMARVLAAAVKDAPRNVTINLVADSKGIWALSVDVNTGDEIWRTPKFGPEDPAEDHLTPSDAR